MKILIVGGNFNNKGAELMLNTLVSKLNELFIEANVYLSSLVGTKTQRETLNVLELKGPLLHVGDGDKKFYFNWFLNYLPWYKGEGSLWDMDVIIDISGYAYSSKWGNSPVTNVDFILKHKSKKTKFIFLPQAFGPFDNDFIINKMRSVIERSDLIFARDKISYENLKNINNKNNIELFPDITLSYKSKTSSFEESKEVLIVPNKRMLDKSDNWSSNYISLLNIIIDRLNIANEKVSILIHDGEQGEDKELVNSLKGDFNVLLEEDPIKLKQKLSKAKFVIGSRFHALASSLSNSVPCIALGWSHKYEELFELYDLTDFAFLELDKLSILNKIDILLDRNLNSDLRKKITQQQENISDQNKLMWEIIENYIKK
ncbi:polysaccharide pyruvyl transferase family protein [Flammeovirga agarivorans]|uniref:Polysaccharide pyruvyl transferase family protein n=1 Tax=Flammeovirga agarivorans TaxID=2726742 RepID=A0A7X8SMU8_9BACT|nr:polysaccharide pyruvyl transferase family protein [Flammeovirga agarivorans]NLR93087.1 polysaccharide pyruvyl transferase family protein [Flammeovirga agarivorans]